MSYGPRSCAGLPSAVLTEDHDEWQIGERCHQSRTPWLWSPRQLHNYPAGDLRVRDSSLLTEGCRAAR